MLLSTEQKNSTPFETVSKRAVGEPSPRALVIPLGPQKIRDETFFNLDETFYISITKLNHTTMTPEDFSSRINEDDFKKEFLDFIRKMERDLAREEFLFHNPQFEILTSRKLEVTLCKN